MTDSGDTSLFGSLLCLVWGSFALLWFFKRSHVGTVIGRNFKRMGHAARVFVLLFLLAITVYGGGKGMGSSGNSYQVMRIPTIQTMLRPGTNEVFGLAPGALRITSFAPDDDRFHIEVAWPATNLSDYAEIDVFYKRNLDDDSWRWVHREHIWDIGALEGSFSVSGTELPYWEQEVLWRFNVHTNEIAAPFGVTFSNVVARVSHTEEPAAGFFYAASQHDTDGDGASDAVERSLGLDPLDPDMDGDGVPDGREISAGSSPLLLDSDGDGLPDNAEMSWGSADTNGLARWIDISTASNRIVLFTDSDDAAVHMPVPVPFNLFGRTMTNLSVNVNGLVGWSVGDPPFSDGHHYGSGAASIPVSDDPSATVAGFWDDLQAKPALTSCVSVATVENGEIATCVVEFSRMGFWNEPTNHVLSFQIQFSENETNAVHVVVGEVHGRGTGGSATLGMRTSRGESVEYSRDESDAVFPGLALTYHFGLGSDPSKTDSDGDSLTDAQEAVLGTNPVDSDTDGDGLSDPSELGIGIDPLNPDTDADGLSDGIEVEHGLDPDDPSDVLTDHDGDGLTLHDEVLTHQTNPACWDTDADGLSDGEEITHETDPLVWDTDDDGLPDGLEIRIGTATDDWDSDDDGLDDKWEHDHAPFDPLDSTDGFADTDGDGLSNGDEILYRGTDWRTADTDGDGISDGTERNNGTSPVKADTDGDGLSDSVEGTLGTNPNQEDSDGDSCPDGWEVEHGFDPLSSTSPVLAADPDSDGLSNEEEANLGTDPFSSDTDGDGLSDRLEVGWIAQGSSTLYSLDGATNLLDAMSNMDGGRISFPLPFPITVQNAWCCSNMVVSIDGYLNLAPEQESYPSSSPNQRRPLLCKAFRDDLQAYPLELGSLLRAAEVVTNGTRHFVVEYRCFGFYDESPVPSNSVSFQVDFPENAPNEVRVSFFQAKPPLRSAPSDPLSPRALGNNATLSTSTLRTRLEFSDNEPVAAPGLAVVYHLGTGTNPRLADTDGDGVSDGTEWHQGSDPLDPTDLQPHDVVEVTVHFGDDSPSHSEKYEAIITPVIGDTRPPIKLHNRNFGEPDDLSAYLVSNAVYDVSLRHIATNEEAPDLDYTLSVSVADTMYGMAAMVVDPDGLTGSHDNVNSSQFEKTVRIAVVRARILADKNRDGVIDDADATPGPLRMWINDDQDSGAVANGESDVPGQNHWLFGNNASDDEINGVSDLEDFFPVWIDLSDAITMAKTAFPGERFFVRLRCDGAEIGVASTTLDISRAGNHLQDVATAQSLSSARVVRVGSVDASLLPSVLTEMAQNPAKGVFLMEGRTSGRPASFQADLLLHGDVILSAKLPLSVSPVEDFYRWINLRGTVGSDEARLTDLSQPRNFPDDESDMKNIVFVHGFNVTEHQARGWNAEVFKRLWQNGCNSRYYAVTWRGDLSWGIFRGLFYHEDVVNSFLTAPAFASAFSGDSENTAVLAHSLGNMVVCSAIQDHGFRPAVYCMLNAAVPAESIDPNAWSDAGTGNPMVHHRWKDYASRTWAARWHELFPEDDDRNKLTWKGRFSALPTLSGLSLYNFYSSGDEVLGLHDLVGPDGMIQLDYNTGEEKRNHSWQKQERFKGRKHFDFPEEFGATDQAGWGFKYHFESIPFSGTVDLIRDTYLSATDANAATTNQLKTVPVFVNAPAPLFSSTIPKTTRDALLAQAIPALSPPVGAVNISLSGNASDNFDLNVFSLRNPTGSQWPRNGLYGTQFLHSDIKNVALPFVSTVWAAITAIAGFEEN